MNILLAVDGSTYTKKMLAYLVTHEELFAADKHHYTILHVNMPLPEHMHSAIGSSIALENFHTQDSQTILEPVEKFLQQHNMETKTVWKIGNPGDIIADYTNNENIDLLMMGSHGHSALAALIMGSVATRALARCKKPILLVR